MEKYGVEVESEQTKEASDRKMCPRCGTPLKHVEQANVPHCPKCGTEPFEGIDGARAK